MGTHTAWGACTARARLKEAFIITNGELSVYEHVSDESGRWLRLEFCARCASTIGFTLEAVPGIRAIGAGTFDDPAWIRSDVHEFRHVYVRSAGDWPTLPVGVEQYEAHFRS